MERKLFIRKQASDCLELLKGHTPEQRDNWSNATKAVEELAGYILELTNEPPTPISPYWDKIAEQEYPELHFPMSALCEVSNSLLAELQRKAFLKGASMQQLWVPVESGLFPTERDKSNNDFSIPILAFGAGKNEHYGLAYYDFEELKWRIYGTYISVNEVTHWCYITPPGSNTNPIVEQWAALKEWKESAMAVMPDYQKIGEILGVKLGDSIHDKILPAIEQWGKMRKALMEISTYAVTPESKIATEALK